MARGEAEGRTRRRAEDDAPVRIARPEPAVAVPVGLALRHEAEEAAAFRDERDVVVVVALGVLGVPSLVAFASFLLVAGARVVLGR